MTAVALAAALAVLAGPLMAGGLKVCLANPARLDDLTLQVFRQELGAILTASGRPSSLDSCASPAVRITLRQYPGEEEPAALGRTRYVNGRLLPEIDLFVSPVGQIVGTRLPGVIGRALARVAAHELGHWLAQETGHAAHGFMMERLAAGHLMAAGREFFRLPPAD
jgi:hypothetical protein